MRDRVPMTRATFVALAVLGVAAWLLTRRNPLAVLVAVLATWLICKAGLGLLRSFAAPLPEPPPPGELRKVKITYRCSQCGTEVRMTVANDRMPDPPRHCMDEMDLLTPVDDV